MLAVFFVLTWLTGLSLAAAFATSAYGFGRMSEPERTDLISLAIFGVMGLVSQAGLLLAPWAVTRPGSSSASSRTRASPGTRREYRCTSAGYWCTWRPT